MIWKFFPAALLITAVFIVEPVSAAPLDGPPEGAMQRLSCLDLTPQQNQQIRQMQIDLEQAVNPLWIQMFERRAELRLLWMQLDPDEKAIKAKQREVYELRWSIQERETDFWLRVRRALTPNQRAQFLLQAGGPEHSPFPDRHPPPPGRRPPPPRHW